MLLPEAIVRALRAERKGELASLVERKRELASLVERKSALPARSRFLQVPDQLWKLKFDICLEFGVFNFEFQPVCGLWSCGLWSAVCCLSTLHTLILVSRPRNTITFANGAWEARSRNEEEAMSGTSATTRDTEIARNPHQPEGWRRNGIDFFVAPPPRCTRHRVVVASRSRRRCARHKRHDIPGTGH